MLAKKRPYGPPPMLLACCCLASVLLLMLAVRPGAALFIETQFNKRTCFYEELPPPTHFSANFKIEAELRGAVDGSVNASPTGISTYSVVNETMVDILVELTETETKFLNQRASAVGNLAFTSTTSTRHRICFTPLLGQYSGPFIDRLRFHFDFTVGNTPPEEKEPSIGKAHDIYYRIQDLLTKSSNIKREQRYQRDREADFRDISEHVNSRLLIWTAVQLIIIGITCFWQLRHLRGFFNAKKLV